MNNNNDVADNRTNYSVLEIEKSLNYDKHSKEINYRVLLKIQIRSWFSQEGSLILP